MMGSLGSSPGPKNVAPDLGQELRTIPISILMDQGNTFIIPSPYFCYRRTTNQSLQQRYLQQYRLLPKFSCKPFISLDRNKSNHTKHLSRQVQPWPVQDGIDLGTEGRLMHPTPLSVDQCF